MPVEDKPIHALNARVDENYRYAACQSKVRCAGYWVPDGYTMDGRRKEKYIADHMSQECRYDNSLRDVGCTGCPRRGSGERYAALERSKAS